MSTVPDLSVGEQRVLLRDVSWESYVTLADRSDRAGQLMTFDRGLLEIMSPSMAHESDKSLLRRMIQAYSLQHGIDIRSSASTTFRRADLNRGFEADESFYIANERRVRGKRQINLLTDPPPDLVIEIEISKSSIDKFDLLAQLGVPEVWRYDGERIFVDTLVDNQYQHVGESRVLEGFPIALATTILQSVDDVSETQLIREFIAKL